MSQTYKHRPRRVREGYFEKYFVGRGIDIGWGGDAVTEDCDRWDLDQGDALLMQGVPDAHYDWVYSSHCLEHLTDVPGALRRWWQILKPRGHLIVLVPDAELYEQGYWPSRFNTDHKATFSVTTAWPGRTFHPLMNPKGTHFLVEPVLRDLFMPLCNYYDRDFRTFDDNFDYTKLGLEDQSTKENVLTDIEFIVRKP